MATLAPPIETFHSREPREVPEVQCGVCGAWTDSQVYSITLHRALVTRKWFFCGLDHLRVWAEPVH
jgi:hypothetical protein